MEIDGGLDSRYDKFQYRHNLVNITSKVELRFLNAGPVLGVRTRECLSERSFGIVRLTSREIQRYGSQFSRLTTSQLFIATQIIGF